MAGARRLPCPALAALLLAALPAMPPSARAADGDTGAAVVIEDFKYPEYNQDGQVEFILHGRRARKVGILTHVEDARLEWVEELPGADQAAGRAFRVVGTVTTPTAVYDESTAAISGDREIHYRSDGMDVDGVGFDVHHQEQTLHVRSKVRVVLRDDLRTDAERQPAPPSHSPPEEGTQE